MNYLMDYLGGANFAGKIKRYHPRGFGAGFILDTNNPDWPKTDCWPIIDHLAQAGECPIIRVHAMWDDDHQYLPRYEDAIMRSLGELNKRAQQYHHVRFMFSPLCERDNDSPAFEKLWQSLLDSRHHSIALVNSVTKARYRVNAINEFHGAKAKPQSGRFGYSFDGKNVWDQNIQKYKNDLARAEYIALWVCLFNGKWNDKAKHEKGADVTPRPKRKAWPYPEVFPMVSALAGDPGAVELSNKHIWKPQADQHGPERQPREGKPVFITPVAGSECRLMSSNGKLIAVMPRDGNFTDGRPKYRCNLFGFKVAEKAMQLSGSPLVTLRIGTVQVGRIHPAFRAGSFR